MALNNKFVRSATCSGVGALHPTTHNPNEAVGSTPADAFKTEKRDSSSMISVESLPPENHYWYVTFQVLQYLIADNWY